MSHTVDVFVTGGIRHTVIASREFVICAVTLVITMPLSLYKDISKLGKVKSSIKLYRHSEKFKLVDIYDDILIQVN